MKQVTLRYANGPAGPQLAAPTYQMLPGTHAPITPGFNDANGVFPGVLLGDARWNGLTVQALIPDEDADIAGQNIDAAKIKQRYPGHFLITAGTIK